MAQEGLRGKFGSTHFRSICAPPNLIQNQTYLTPSGARMPVKSFLVSFFEKGWPNMFCEAGHARVCESWARTNSRGPVVDKIWHEVAVPRVFWGCLGCLIYWTCTYSIRKQAGKQRVSCTQHVFEQNHAWQFRSPRRQCVSIPGQNLTTCLATSKGLSFRVPRTCFLHLPPLQPYNTGSICTTKNS